MSLGYRIGIWALIGVALVSAITLSYRHYSGLVESKVTLSAQIATLNEDVAREKARADAYERSIDKWDEAAEVQAKALTDNTAAQREAGAYSRELKDVLSSHNLGALAKSKPGLIERRVNDGTARTFRLLEQSTESPAGTRSESASSSSAAKP